MQRMKEDIAVSLSKSQCRLHAYVIMTNHLHLLLTSKDKEQLSIFMQSMANRYVRYFNVKHQRTGTLWEGRFKSCVVDSDNYLFALYKYIESNPVRAGMVKQHEDYAWSSYHHNALGKTDPLMTEHKLYKALGKTVKKRCSAYQQLFDQTDLSDEKSAITDATEKGEVYGSRRFHAKIAGLITRPTKLGAHGGDRKSEAYQNQAG